MIPFRTNCFAKNTQWTSTPQCTDLHSCWFTTFTQTWVVPASRFSPPLKPQWTGKTTKGWAPNSPEKCLQELQPHSKAWQLLQLSLGLKRFMGLGNLLRIFNLAPNWNSDQTVLERIGTETPHHNAQSRGLWIITAADLQLSLKLGSFLRLGFLNLCNLQGTGNAQKKVELTRHLKKCLQELQPHAPWWGVTTASTLPGPRKAHGSQQSSWNLQPDSQWKIQSTWFCKGYAMNQHTTINTAIADLQLSLKLGSFLHLGCLNLWNLKGTRNAQKKSSSKMSAKLATHWWNVTTASTPHGPRNVYGSQSQQSSWNLQPDSQWKIQSNWLCKGYALNQHTTMHRAIDRESSQLLIYN
jgi:hypothetical protein